MRMDQKLELKQKLGLVPQMLLEAELLQLQIIELRQRIQRELETNPVLEEEPREELPVEEDEELKDENLKEILELSADPKLPLSIEKDDEDEDRESRWEAPQVGFWERVDAQLEVLYPKGSKCRKIAEAIINSLDGMGYLSRSIEEIAKELNVKESEVEYVRQEIMRGFDPVGVAAKNLREMFMVQLEDRGLTDTLAYKIVKDYWDRLEKEGLEFLAKGLGLDEEKRKELGQIFRSLYSSPQDKYSEERSEYVYPEVIFKVVDDKLVVELMEWDVPSLQLSPYYLEMLYNEGCSKEAKQFLRMKVRRAMDFLRAIENRRHNILKVSEFIAEMQRDFLLGKTKFLKPITQTEAAHRLNIPISTFNRVVKGRYADTPVGVFELRFFFTKGISKGDEQVSSDELKNAIRKLIENEDPHHPLSDQEIADLLRKEGFKIARRTVAEYRKEMGIPKSSKRRKRE
jgi:RNA polymerase sigma-54 factor